MVLGDFCERAIRPRRGCNPQAENHCPVSSVSAMSLTMHIKPVLCISKDGITRVVQTQNAPSRLQSTKLWQFGHIQDVKKGTGKKEKMNLGSIFISWRKSYANDYLVPVASCFLQGEAQGDKDANFIEGYKC